MNCDERKRGAFLIIGLIFSIGLFGQSAVLEGRIYSRESFENISHANIILRNSEGLVVTSITTGLDGKYATDSLEPGAYALEVYSRYHKTEHIKVVYLQPGQLSTIDISMSSGDTKSLSEAPTSETPSKETQPEEESEKKFKLFEFLGDILKTSVVAGI